MLYGICFLTNKEGSVYAIRFSWKSLHSRIKSHHYNVCLFEEFWLWLLCMIFFRRAMLCASVEETTSKVSPWSKVSWPMDVYVFSLARVTPATAQGEGESANASPSGAALLMLTSQFSTWSLSRRVSGLTPCYGSFICGTTKLWSEYMITFLLR